MEIAYVVILFAVLIVLLIAGIPVSFAMGISGILGIIFFIGPTQLQQISSIILHYGTNSSLLVAPMFVLMAEILVVSGISRDLYDGIYKWFNRVPGSLAVTTVLASAGFASVCGSSPATVATVAPISAPEMIKRNYSRKLISGSIVTGGTLGILIPPSMALIIQGIVTETSIVKLFIAGIIPGILLTAILVLTIIITVLLCPEYAPKGRMEEFTWFEKFSALKKIIPVVILAFVLIYSMYTGIATATEAAGVGVVIALFISIVMKRMTWKKLQESLYRSAKTSAMILFLIFGGVIFSFVVGYLGAADLMMDFLMQFNLDRWVIFFIFIVILLILGMFMDPISMIMLTMPIMFPIIMELGFDPVWFGIIVTITLEIGMITPPVGLNLFVLKGTVPQLDLMDDIVKGSLPYIFIFILFIILLCVFPILTTLLI